MCIRDSIEADRSLFRWRLIEPGEQFIDKSAIGDRFDHDDQGAERDRHIGDIERGKRVLAESERKEVRHIAEANTIDHVPDRSAEHDAEQDHTRFRLRLLDRHGNQPGGGQGNGGKQKSGKRQIGKKAPGSARVSRIDEMKEAVAQGDMSCLLYTSRCV